MKLSLERRGDIVRVRVPGPRLETVAAQQFRDALAELLEGRPQTVLLDLSDVREIDSAGLGSLVSALKSARCFGGSIQLCGLQAGVREVIELTMLHRVLPIQEVTVG